MITPEGPDRAYSTRLRTGLLFTGAGTAGAYHAGVLRAFQEAGIKVDLVAGRGVGAVAALFAAIDGGARLWDAEGVWKSPGASRYYGWTRALRAAGIAVAAAGLVLALPLVLLAVAVLAGCLGLLLSLAGLEEAGSSLTTAFTTWVATLFAPDALPTAVPRLVLLSLLVGIGILAVALLISYLRDPVKRRERSGFIPRLFGAPLTTDALLARVSTELWNLIRGAAPLAAPTRAELARKYVELLVENHGQPGFRELLLTVHDVDARRDFIFATLGATHRRRFFTRPGADADRRRLEAFDLSGAARDHVLDVLGAALAVPLATAPPAVRFSPEGPWRGEAHRLADRPEALIRLVEEAAHAGIEQLVIVSAAPLEAGTHELSAGRADLRGRAGEQMAAFETAALRDVVELFTGRFASLFVIRPSHNALGPLDFNGLYDERSDRRQTPSELVDRGYEDAYRQFIEPVVGAGAEPADAVQRMNGGAAVTTRL